MKKTLITGLTGQDGMHLAKLLQEKNYQVHGIVRRTSFENPRVLNLRNTGVVVHEGDLTDSTSLSEVLKLVQPDEVYNLAAQSHVHTSFNCAESTLDITGLGTLRLLNACFRNSTLDKPIKFYQASSSEMFGGLEDGFYSERSPFHPRSPYAVAKVMAHHACVNFREAYNAFICCGVLFNHESELRGENFVTRKISKAVARIKHSLITFNKCSEKLTLGNLDACRDWGYAPEYVEGMWRMLQKEKPDDYVLATGTSWSVREFCEFAFGSVDLNWQDWVEVSDEFKRPAEVSHLLGDYSKARKVLGWRPRTYTPELAKIMVDADLKLFREDKK